MTRGSRRRNPIHNRNLSESELPTLVQLDGFSESSLRQWQAAGSNLTELQTALFFGLELERQRHSEALIDAVRGSLTCGEPFEHWARIVDYRYCFSPLSVAGSVQRDGGRFNMGAALNPVTFPPFPALYIAESYPTAYKERFGSEPDETAAKGLTADEVALRAPGSFTHVALRGRVELLMDIRETHSLQKVVAAGAHAILYSSVRQAGSACLALFPQNWLGTSSFVEVMDGAPSQARLVRVDGCSRAFH